MIKQSLLILSLFLLTFQGWAQTSSGVIGMPELNILYRGYNNLIEVLSAGPNGTSNIKMVGEGCVVTEHTDTKGKGWPKKFIVAVKTNERFAEVHMLDGDELVRNWRFRVSNMPIPSLYFGAASSGGGCSRSSSKLFIKYPPEIALKAPFRIEDWECELLDKKTSGSGSILNKDVMVALQSVPRDTEFHVVVTCVGVDGIKRKIGGVFIVK
ncbi:MAG: hypothetical protein QNK23_07165 [Crocinitomicaceae bacterium]|nr:hypothetical protein [Crocinitomicaceae bacterium]